MLIGHDVSGWIDEKAGAKALQRLSNLARAAAISSKKLRSKLFEGIADLTPNDSFRIDVDDRRQYFRDREHGRLRSGIGLGKTNCRSCENNSARCEQDRRSCLAKSHFNCSTICAGISRRNFGASAMRNKSSSSFLRLLKRRVACCHA